MRQREEIQTVLREVICWSAGLLTRSNRSCKKEHTSNSDAFPTITLLRLTELGSDG